MRRQVAVHAIGDRAVEEVLELFAELAANSSSESMEGSGSGSGSGTSGGSIGNGSGSTSARPAGRAPHRIEHVQHISGPATAQRLAAAGVAVTPNPLHLLADAGILEARLGRERAGAGRSYALRTLLEANVTAALASDWPVVPLEPLSGGCWGGVVAIGRDGG